MFASRSSRRLNVATSRSRFFRSLEGADRSAGCFDLSAPSQDQRTGLSCTLPATVDRREAAPIGSRFPLCLMEQEKLVAGARYVPNLDTLCIPFRSELIHCGA
jgi:hypothetical protein